MMMKEHWKSAILANMACVFLWGFSFISIKIAVPVFPPMTLGAVRFAGAIALLFLMYNFSRKEKGSDRKNLKEDFLLLIGSGLAGVTFYFFCENNGVALVTASEASIIVAAIPVLTMSADWLAAKITARGIGEEEGVHELTRIITDEKTGKYDARDSAATLGWRHWLGAFISIAGVMLVAGVSFSLSGSIAGYVYMGGAALCWVAYGFLTRPLFTRKRSRIYIVFWQNVFGFLGFLPFAALEYKNWGTPTVTVILHVIFLAVFCSALGYWLYARALEVLGVSVSSVFINLIPVVTVIAGFFILGERLTLLQCAGAALVLGGVYLTVLPGRRQEEEPRTKTTEVL